MKKLLILLIAVTMLLGITAAASASTTLTGTLYYRLDSGDLYGGTLNNSDVNFFRISVATDATFNDKSDCYLTLQCQTYLPDRYAENAKEATFMWNIYTYGYNYSLNDRWDLGVTYSCEGVTLSDGKLATDWQWHHISSFDKMNAIKLVGSPLDTINVGLYYSPPTLTVPMIYLVKGKFMVNGFKIGAGYSNTSKNGDYNVYTEITPFKNCRIYLDYAKLADEVEYLIESSLGVGPLTAKLTASNEDQMYLNRYRIFKPNTADVSLNYAFSGKKSLTAGLMYDYNNSSLKCLYSKYDSDLGYAEIRQDGELTWTYLTETHLKAGYRFDHTNLLEADYNITTGSWYTGMAVYF